MVQEGLCGAKVLGPMGWVGGVLCGANPRIGGGKPVTQIMNCEPAESGRLNLGGHGGTSEEK